MKRIMLAGPSGIGKTTIAKWISEKIGIEFISGSVSDLLPDTKDVPHSEMLSKDPTELYKEDYQILNLRNKLFRDKHEFVSDRSYLDSIAYFLYKQAENIPSCEIDHFISLAKQLLSSQCDLLIVLELHPYDLHEWVTEDNDKRITNNYFQLMISSLMGMSLSLIGYENIDSIDYLTKFGLGWYRTTPLDHPYDIGVIRTVYGSTEVVIIRDLKLDTRQKIISKFIK